MNSECKKSDRVITYYPGIDATQLSKWSNQMYWKIRSADLPGRLLQIKSELPSLSEVEGDEDAAICVKNMISAISVRAEEMAITMGNSLEKEGVALISACILSEKRENFIKKITGAIPIKTRAAFLREFASIEMDDRKIDDIIRSALEKTLSSTEYSDMGSININMPVGGITILYRRAIISFFRRKYIFTIDNDVIARSRGKTFNIDVESARKHLSSGFIRSACKEYLDNVYKEALAENNDEQCENIEKNVCELLAKYKENHKEGRAGFFSYEECFTICILKYREIEIGVIENGANGPVVILDDAQKTMVETTDIIREKVNQDTLREQ